MVKEVCPAGPVTRSAAQNHSAELHRAGRTADKSAMNGQRRPSVTGGTAPAGAAASTGPGAGSESARDRETRAGRPSPSAELGPPGPTSAAGRFRGWRRRPPPRITRPGGSRLAGWPRRVVVLAAGAGLLLTVLVVAVLPPLGRLADESARLGVAVSAWGAVTEARTANAEGEAALLAMVAETAPEARAVLVGQSMERGQYARGLMDKSAQPADPATAVLRTRLNTDWTTATELSTALASARIRAGGSAPLPAGTVSAQFRAYQAVNADLAALAQHYQQVVTDLTGQLSNGTAHTRGRLLLVYGCGLGLLALLLIPGVRQARRWAAQDRRRVAQATSADVETRVRRAYEMADSEADALAVTGRALTEVLAGHRSRLLLADSSHAHLTSLLDTAPDVPSCSPDTPDQCPAAARGQLCAFPDSSTLDACPRLPAARGPVAASCAPISVAGRSVGVLQLTAPIAARLARSEDTAATQQLIARRLGDRLSILRAFARSERQATTDPLTGLLNRRSLEDRVPATAADPAGYAVAYLDIDRFKQLNDTHGHAAGDRALRAFATTLRRRLRPRDLIGRWGGEEFLAVLPDCDRDQARTVMERLRADLLDTLAAGDTPGFTISCGIATSADAPTFTDVVHRADQALLAAKAAGRDRVIDCTTPS